MMHSQFDHAGYGALDPLDVWRVVHDPLLRWHEVPRGHALAQQLMVDPSDQYLHELFALRVREQIGKAMVADNPFHGQYPPRGALPPVGPGRVPLASLPTGDVLSIGIDDLTRNLLLVGPVGGGKTTLLRGMLLALLEACTQRHVTVIAFNPKGDLVLECETLCRAGLPVLVLDWTELQIAMLQPPRPDMPLTAFITGMVDLLASHTGLIASRRLMMETLHLLFRRARPAGTWPRLSDWLAMITNINASGLSRLGFYKEGVMYALSQMRYTLGPSIDYASSSMLDQLIQFNGVVVIQTDGVDADNASFLAGLFAKHAYDSRASYLDDDDVDHHPVLLCLDDAMKLVQTRMSVGGEEVIDPISAWVLLARSRQIGFIVAAQNFNLISPTLKNNVANVVVCGSFGRDAQELAKYLNLDKDQAKILPVLQPGEVIAIARSTWPLAVYGRVPMVQ